MIRPFVVYTSQYPFSSARRYSQVHFGSVEISWGLFFILVRYCLLRIMKNDYLNMLASLVLPAQILDYFLISGVEQTSQEIHISLDEKMNPELSNNIHFESKGFMQHGSVSKLNRAIPSSAVGARFARPKTVCFVSSGRRTLPLGTKRQHYPHFDTSPCL